MKPSCKGPQLSQLGVPQQPLESDAARRVEADVPENLLRMSGGNDAAAIHHDYPFNKSERKVKVMHHNDAEPVSPTPNQTP
jgi:hypothetical protein